MKTHSKKSLIRWVDRTIAVIGLINLGLIAFDLSYIPWRDIYLRHFPELTQWYGAQFKGIEPHRDTTAYLQKVDELEEQVAVNGLRSPQVSALLADLRDSSSRMIEDNPFALVGKTGTLERIKNEMRDRFEIESSRTAFNTFWSQAHLTQAGWSQEIQFFNGTIRPRMETNYYRSIGEDGSFTDRFWHIDIWFVAIFGADFVLRTLALRRRYRGVSWLDTMIWRWYDLFLLLPFLRWLRVIPVGVRLNQSGLVNLEPLRNRLTHTLISNFAVELTEIVVLRVINQTQNMLREGAIARWLLKPETRRYIDLNGVDEVEIIVTRVLNILVQNVMPKIQPDIEALIRHSIAHALEKTPVYQQVQNFPGLSNFPHQIAEQVATQATNSLYGILSTSLDDPVAVQLTRRLIDNFGKTFREEVQQQRTVDELESLVTDLLDEIKLNYVQQVETLDAENVRDQTHQIYQITRTRI